MRVEDKFKITKIVNNKEKRFCFVCLKWLDLKKFSKHKNSLDGYKRVCRDCVSKGKVITPSKRYYVPTRIYKKKRKMNLYNKRSRLNSIKREMVKDVEMRFNEIEKKKIERGNKLKIEDIAKVCHSTNRVYCQLLGDDSQAEWENTPEWQKVSAIEGVKAHLRVKSMTFIKSHNSWLKHKKETGWVYGKVKDSEKKTHPCMVAFKDLPKTQQTKDKLFCSIVNSMKNLLNKEELESL